ncbi:MAG: carboxypeptidase-like regulatory domain-containing protein [Proteobacteria bacterium]|nr:carboxypeptidase-like regulatory domain-containing protein [Pseudomonadota bacterium]
MTKFVKPKWQRLAMSSFLVMMVTVISVVIYKSKELATPVLKSNKEISTTTQQRTFSIAGRIVNGNGATVTVKGTSETKSTIADGEGRYLVPGLSPGNYTFQAYQKDPRPDFGPGEFDFLPNNFGVSITSRDVTVDDVTRYDGEGLPEKLLEALDKIPDTFVPLNEIILDNGVDLATYAADRGITSGANYPSIAGVYEYEYPDNTEHFKENHYIVLNGPSHQMTGIYYGTTDEFDKGREGYLPGFFKANMGQIVYGGDTLTFLAIIRPEEIFDSPITPADSPDKQKQMHLWKYRPGDSSKVKYMLKRVGNDLVKDEGALGLRRYVKKR